MIKKIIPEQVRAISNLSFSIRLRCLEFITTAGWGHIGGSFSEADILATLYSGILDIEPEYSDKLSRDRFVLSKAHASPALYAVLALKGFFPVEDLYNYCRINGLDGHTQRGQCPGIEYSGGSLGTGLSYSVGLANALRRNEIYSPRVYCLIGDGECQEGQIWEAAMSAAHYRLDNLIAIVDYNKVMAKGKVSDLMAIDPIDMKFESFGWSVLRCDGHDIEDLWKTFYTAKYLGMNGQPVAIIAHTVKGKGVPEAEFNYQWHTHAPSQERAQDFLQALNQTYGQSQAFSRELIQPSDGGLQAVIEADLNSN